MHFNDEREPQAKYAALVREVEQERLARMVIARRRPATRRSGAILARLGDLMIMWGWRLRARYSSLES